MAVADDQRDGARDALVINVMLYDGADSLQSFGGQPERFRLSGGEILRERAEVQNKNAEQNRNGVPVPRGKNATACFLPLRLDGLGSRVPGDRLLAEIRFVRHVAGNGGVVAENRVLGHRLARFH